MSQGLGVGGLQAGHREEQKRPWHISNGLYRRTAKLNMKASAESRLLLTYAHVSEIRPSLDIGPAAAYALYKMIRRCCLPLLLFAPLFAFVAAAQDAAPTITMFAPTSCGSDSGYTCRAGIGVSWSISASCSGSCILNTASPRTGPNQEAFSRDAQANGRIPAPHLNWRAGAGRTPSRRVPDC